MVLDVSQIVLKCLGREAVYRQARPRHLATFKLTTDTLTNGAEFLVKEIQGIFVCLTMSYPEELQPLSYATRITSY